MAKAHDNINNEIDFSEFKLNITNGLFTADTGEEKRDSLLENLYYNLSGKDILKYRKDNYERRKEGGQLKDISFGRVYEVPVDESGVYSEKGEDTRRYLAEDKTFFRSQAGDERQNLLTALMNVYQNPSDSLSSPQLDSLKNQLIQPDTETLYQNVQERNLDDVNSYGQGGWNTLKQLEKPKRRGLFRRNK